MLRQRKEQELTTESDGGFVRLLDNKTAEHREDERQLFNGTPERIEDLIAVLERENRKKPWRFGLFVVLFMACIMGLTSLVSTLFTGHFKLGGFGYPMYMAAAALAAGLAPTGLQKKAARALAASDDIRAAGPLTEALKRQDKQTRTAAESAMTRLLPRMRAEQSDLLNDTQRDILKERLEGDKNTDLFVAMLAALEQVGDERFLPAVKKLAEGKGNAKKEPRIRVAAERCLPFLEERVENDKAARTLLRPAAAVTDESLLRPAGANESDSASLLRPAEEPDQRS